MVMGQVTFIPYNYLTFAMLYFWIYFPTCLHLQIITEYFFIITSHVFPKSKWRRKTSKILQLIQIWIKLTVNVTESKRVFL